MRRYLYALPLATALGLTSVGFAQISGPTPLAWRWTGTTSQSPQGAALVSGDNAFVAVGARVYCLDKATGNKKWQMPAIEPIDGIFTSNLILNNGVLYAAGSNKTLYAINPQTGETKWSYVAPGAIVGKPILAGNTIVLNIDGRAFIAVDLDTGANIYTNPERVFDGIRGEMYAIGTDVFYVTQRLDIYSTSVATRKANRMSRLQIYPSNAKPTVYGGNAYLVSGQTVLELSPSGQPRIQKNVGETLLYGVAVSPDGIAAVGERGNMYILEPDGSTRSKPGTRGQAMKIDLGSRAIAAPTAVGKFFAVTVASGAVALVDPHSGDVVWSYTIRPVTAGLKSSASSGNSGNPSGPRAGGSSSSSSGSEDIISIPAAGPVSTDNKSMYVLALDGSLLCFDAENGVDLTGPSCKALWPQAGLQVGSAKGPLDIYLQLADEATGINDKSLKITVNGKEVKDYNLGRDGVLYIHFGQGTKNGMLQNGRAEIEVTVSDWMGNLTKSKVNYTIDNDLPPLALPGGAAPGGGILGGPGGGGGGSAKGG